MIDQPIALRDRLTAAFETMRLVAPLLAAMAAGGQRHEDARASPCALP